MEAASLVGVQACPTSSGATLGPFSLLMRHEVLYQVCPGLGCCYHFDWERVDSLLDLGQVALHIACSDLQVQMNGSVD